MCIINVNIHEYTNASIKLESNVRCIILQSNHITRDYIPHVMNYVEQAVSLICSKESPIMIILRDLGQR